MNPMSSSTRQLQTRVIDISSLAMEGLDLLRPVLFSIQQLSDSGHVDSAQHIRGLCKLANWVIDDYFSSLNDLQTEAEQSLRN
ncbi:hypothetical protein HZU77_002520 [Neisseriaceae bacterium TC5R-5]|nr:hypothetical protein [Neisseriaceae bacterium TC5R-5]